MIINVAISGIIYFYSRGQNCQETVCLSPNSSTSMIRQQQSPPPPPPPSHQCCSAAEKKAGPSSGLQTNIELGGGGVKVWYFPGGVFFLSLCAKFVVFLTTFVHDCMYLDDILRRIVKRPNAILLCIVSYHLFVIHFIYYRLVCQVSRSLSFSV